MLWFSKHEIARLNAVITIHSNVMLVFDRRMSSRRRTATCVAVTRVMQTTNQKAALSMLPLLLPQLRLRWTEFSATDIWVAWRTWVALILRNGLNFVLEMLQTIYNTGQCFLKALFIRQWLSCVGGSVRLSIKVIRDRTSCCQMQFVTIWQQSSVLDKRPSFHMSVTASARHVPVDAWLPVIAAYCGSTNAALLACRKWQAVGGTANSVLITAVAGEGSIIAICFDGLLIRFACLSW